jgi:hypothetical protein
MLVPAVSLYPSGVLIFEVHCIIILPGMITQPLFRLLTSDLDFVKSCRGSILRHFRLRLYADWSACGRHIHTLPLWSKLPIWTTLPLWSTLPPPQKLTISDAGPKSNEKVYGVCEHFPECHTTFAFVVVEEGRAHFASLSSGSAISDCYATSFCVKKKAKKKKVE